MKKDKNADKYTIKVVEKTLKILELFKEKGKELTATEINDLLNYNKVTTFRIIKNLEKAEYLEKDPKTLKYQLGLKIFYLGSMAEPHAKIRKIARPFLEKLNQKSEETVHLAALHLGEVLYLDKFEGKKTIRVSSRVGIKLPAHCTGVGKVLLADLSEEALTNLLEEKGLKPFTDNTIVDRKILKAELAKIRKKGYAIDNEEIEEGLNCIAAPLIDSQGKFIASMSISVPKVRFDRNFSTFVSLIIKSAEEISKALIKQGVNNTLHL
jgi:DNA-binding IclR family transcriptional regulator